MSAIYIPTLSRFDSLERIMPAWLDQDIPVRLVVDPAEFSHHVAFRDSMDWNGLVGIVPVPQDGRGIGYKRRYCVWHADKTGHESIIMSDDDHKPRAGTDVGLLLDFAEKPDVLGIGACVQIYSRFTGGAISELAGPILWPGGAGFSVYGLNIAMALHCGSYSSRLHSFGEDAELRRQGLSRGIPWYVHCDVRVDAINQRNSPGGFMAKYDGDIAARTAAENECRALIYRWWPKYVSPPDQRPRMAWQRMLGDFIPCWRDLSALHGGSL
jgi:hypothetical protein